MGTIDPNKHVVATPFDIDSLNAAMGQVIPPSTPPGTNLRGASNLTIRPRRPSADLGPRFTRSVPVAGAPTQRPGLRPGLQATHRVMPHTRSQPRRPVSYPPPPTPPESTWLIPQVPAPQTQSANRHDFYPNQHTRNVAAWQDHFSAQLQSAIQDPNMQKQGKQELEAAATLLMLGRPIGSRAESAPEPLTRPTLLKKDALRSSVEQMLEQMGKNQDEGAKGAGTTKGRGQKDKTRKKQKKKEQ